jgi:hypothetical protein
VRDDCGAMMSPSADSSNEPDGRFHSTNAMSYDEALKECQRLDATEKFIEHLPAERDPGVWTITSGLRSNWREYSTSDRIDRPVREGERFVARSDVEVLVMTHWLAPFTGGHKAVLPAGTTIVARSDQMPDVPGFNCVPEDYAGLEPILVPEEDRNANKYGGYSLSFTLDDIGTLIDPAG